MNYEEYYPIVLGVLQNNDFLVADAERLEDRSFVKGSPRSGAGVGVEIEIRRRPKGVDAHVLVVPFEDLPREPGTFLIRQGAFGYLRGDPASRDTLDALLPSLRRDDFADRPTDPRFARGPSHIPEWIFFDLQGGAVTFFLGTLLGTVATMYLLFASPDGLYRGNPALLAGFLLILAPWFAGMLARTVPRGYVAGLVTVALPVALYVVSALGLGLPGLRRDPGVPVIDAIIGVLPGPAGLAAAAVLGLSAGLPGAIAGAVGGRIYPIRVRRPALTP